MPELLPAKPVFFFDGVCNMCNALVNFMIDRDPHGRVQFAAIQSAKGQELLAAHGVDAANLDTAYFLEGGRIYDRSTAVFRAMRLLKFPWNLGYWQIVLPKRLRDWNYSLVVARRYRWFGKSDTCRIPTPELKARFLNS